MSEGDSSEADATPDRLAEAIATCRRELRAALAARDSARVRELEHTLAHLIRKLSAS